MQIKLIVKLNNYKDKHKIRLIFIAQFLLKGDIFINISSYIDKITQIKYHLQRYVI